MSPYFSDCLFSFLYLVFVVFNADAHISRRRLKSLSDHLPIYPQVYEALYNHSELVSMFRRKQRTTEPPVSPGLECEYPPSSETDMRHLTVRKKRLTSTDSLACLEDYPYTASVRINGKHWCGGALVAPQWVLSAGFCFDGVSIREVSVRLGSVFRDYGGFIYSVATLKRHPDYHKPDDHNYNLAMVKLNMPAKLTARIRPVSLPTPFSEMSDYPYIGEIVVSGFGTTGADIIQQGENQELRVMVVSDIADNDCQNAYKEEYTVGRSQLCLKSEKKGVSLCTGDIGNPAVLFTNSNREGTLVGIAVYSGNEECAEKKRPGVYIKVSHSAVWIRNLIRGAEVPKKKKRNLILLNDLYPSQKSFHKNLFVIASD